MIWLIFLLFGLGIDYDCEGLKNLGRINKTAPTLFFL